MNVALLITCFGGLGLFLLGMRMMTSGLSLAAGRHLRSILGNWTKTPLRGLFSGFLLTAILQSSGAITVAVIGFVNAGLLKLSQSVGIVYGSNIGTTVTGWIVAAVGLNINIKALALPLIGLGAALNLTGKHTRREPLGDALAGFGLFFLGIEILQNAFQGLDHTMDIALLSGLGIWTIPVFLGVGCILTVLMQSSSAAMILVLTAAVSGIVDVHTAAATVIGTNIGATSTAALAVLGATYNAKKVAASHIIFNVGTTIVALASLPLLLRLVEMICRTVGLQNDVAITLALFHTMFNLFGVLLFLPFTKKLVRFLNARIGREEMLLSKPKYLDKNVLTQPHLALEALFMELGRSGEMTRDLARKALKNEFNPKLLEKDRSALNGLVTAIRKFCIALQRHGMGSNASDMLAKGLRVTQYEMRVSEIITELSQAPGRESIASSDVALAETAFQKACMDILNVADTPCASEFFNLDQQLAGILDQYHMLKAALLQAGADGSLDMETMAYRLEFLSRVRRMVEQAIKAVHYWISMKNENFACQSRLHDNEQHSQ